MKKINPMQNDSMRMLFVAAMLIALFSSVFFEIIDIMYVSPTENNNFSSFFKGAVAVAVLLGIILSFKSARNWLPATAIILLLAGAIISLLMGHMYGYNSRTEGFTLYFVCAAASILLFVLVFTMLVKYLVVQENGRILNYMYPLAAGTAIGYLMSLALSVVELPAIFIWYLIVVLLLILAYIFLKERPLLTRQNQPAQ